MADNWLTNVNISSDPGLHHGRYRGISHERFQTIEEPRTLQKRSLNSLNIASTSSNQIQFYSQDNDSFISDKENRENVAGPAVVPAFERALGNVPLSTQLQSSHPTNSAGPSVSLRVLRELPVGSLNVPSRQRSLNDLAQAALMFDPRVIPRPNSTRASGLMSLRNCELSSTLMDRGPEQNLQSFRVHADVGLSMALTPRGPLMKPPKMFEPNQSVFRAMPSPGPVSAFVPMLAVTRPDKTGKDFTPISLASPRVASLKFSPRYHGMHTENNASNESLKPEENCALWLTNLPPDVTDRELLGAIRNIGRIYATFINYPDFVMHNSSAAKVVFFTPEAAQRLLAYCTTVQPMIIRGFPVKMALNRIKYARSSMDNGESRVLIITGHTNLVNNLSLTKYFEARFAFQIDDVRTLIRYRGRAVIEYKFGSYRCQSQMGMKALMLDRPQGLEMVEYGADPCEVGSEDTSFSIAGERIQGKGLMMAE